MKVTKYNIYITLSILFVLSSCNEEKLNLKNKKQYSAETYFSSPAQYNEGVMATYFTLMHHGLYANNYFLYDLLGNDGTRNVKLSGDLAQVFEMTYGNNNDYLKNVWHSYYRLIFRANLVIDKAENWVPKDASEENLKNQYIGEVKFLRAFAYFNLVTLWGRVPLKLKFSDGEFTTPRSSVAEVWKAIEADLGDAIKKLPVSYDEKNIGRATRGAAIALLGKSFLYQQKYTDAILEFEKLSQAPFDYSLNPSYDDQFSINNNVSKETIFDIQHKLSGSNDYIYGEPEIFWADISTHSARNVDYGFIFQNVKMSDASVSAYTYKDEDDNTYTDPRAKYIFYGDAESGADTTYCDNCPGGKKDYVATLFTKHGYMWRKYSYYEKVETVNAASSEINTQVIRYADVLLMLAECYIETENFEEGIELINTVRARLSVNAFQYDKTKYNSRELAMPLLIRERQLELMGEQIRWFDLVRWKIAKEVLNAEKGTPENPTPFKDDRYYLLPIPLVEIQTNPSVQADVANSWN